MTSPGARRPRHAPVARALTLAVAVLSAGATARAQNQPFGSHPMSYAAGTIRPSHVAQPQLDQAVRDFYDAWKATYLRQTCGTGRWVVAAHTRSGNLTVSEAHGYGMLIAALMAGHDPDARAIFDGMYAFFREHPSIYTPNLMAWFQTNGCRDAEGGDSASDGDLDVAFALLLADRQWGSCGAVDYAAAAQAVIADIRTAELDPTGGYVLLGDWATPAEGDYHTATRSSDFMPDHYRAFADASGDPAWPALVDATYQLVDTMQTTHAPATGLLPDFVRHPLTAPTPAAPDFLEGPNDGAYDYNACRVPWRLATDAVVNGEPRARTAVERIVDWAQAATGGNPAALRAGYRLDGTPSPDSDYLSLAFLAPLGVGAMVDGSNQAWLNATWDRVVGTPLADGEYYENTLKLLAMLVMSGNWWSPERVAAGPCDPGGMPACQAGGVLADARVDLAGMGLGAGRQSLKLSGAMFFAAGRPTAFPLDGGAQLLVEDLGAGGAAVFELTEATDPIPGAAAGGCHPADGWRTSKSTVGYRNRSTALDPPVCTPGSAAGLGKLQYKPSTPRDVALRALVKRGTIPGPVPGPLRVTAILGPSGAAGDAGACALGAPLSCKASGTKIRCE